MTPSSPIYCLPPFPREGFSDILQRHGALIQQRGEQRCTGCFSFLPRWGHCGQRLLPVTSDGLDCPYYEARPPLSQEAHAPL